MIKYLIYKIIVFYNNNNLINFYINNFNIFDFNLDLYDNNYIFFVF